MREKGGERTGWIRGRTDDIAYAVGDEVHGCYCGLLRVAGDVGADEGEERHEGYRTGLRKVVAEQQSLA